MEQPEQAAARRRRRCLLSLLAVTFGIASTNFVARAESPFLDGDTLSHRRDGAHISPGGADPGATSIESIGTGRTPAPVVLAPPPTARTVPPSAPIATPVTRAPRLVRCILMLHGKGATGAPTYQSAGNYLVAPTGNAVAGAGRQWLYAATSEFAQASEVVTNAITATGCTQVVIAGFSNGGSFAAKLYCRGATFGGTVVGYIINDSVTDQSIDPCIPTTSNVVLTQSDELAGYIGAGGPCPTAWTCEGTLTSQAAYATRLGLIPIRHSTHAIVPYPPLAAAWWY